LSYISSSSSSSRGTSGCIGYGIADQIRMLLLLLLVVVVVVVPHVDTAWQQRPWQ